MARKLARIVRIDAISPIAKADAIECAHVGGWTVVVKKGEFAPGDLAIYFEIDAFLPEGNPAWQFLVDKVPFDFDGRRGHVLRSVTMRGQVSQGLLLPLMAEHAGACLGQDVSELLGVVKYEPPIPKELAGKARGYRPSLVPETDEERVQNLALELAEWVQAAPGELVWEETEKLEGNSCSYALLDDEFRVCSRQVDYYESDDNPLWTVARRLEVEHKLRHHFGSRNIVLQGELVGPGIEGNIYGLTEHRFYLFRVYEVETGTWMAPSERHALAETLGIPHVPVIDGAFEFTPGMGMAELLAMADGPSAVNPARRREGIVFKGIGHRQRFKVVSNKYLLNAKL
jgi:RNA ligase (TIGR02306 family)